ncbi:MAG TPA: adenosylcobinamide amidohydrolase [Micromonosporaceae bacterium]|nr:adenosylcobinamide amidohydrolase [Micromonosporaceae bacterium]
MLPTLTDRREGGEVLPVLIWLPAVPLLSISSAVLGGGVGVRNWVVNATVPASYHRPDPAGHLGEIAAALGLAGPGVGLMTAVDVADRYAAEDAGAYAVATVGLGAPTWAAAPDGDLRELRPGTVNTVLHVPVRLSEAALVNAVTTVAEAKAQALGEIGVAATGTASDAVCVLCPADGPAEPYAGPRSTWGARIARAAYAAVVDGGRAWLSGGRTWSDSHG